MTTTPSTSIDSVTQDRQRSAASSVSSVRGLKPSKQQAWAHDRLDMTPLGLVFPQQASMLKFLTKPSCAYHHPRRLLIISFSLPASAPANSIYGKGHV